MSHSELFNINQAAEYLTVKPSTIRKWVWTKQISYVKLNRGAIRIRKQVLDALIEASTVKAAR